MGSGREGKLLDWPECEAVAEKIRFLATEQLLQIWEAQRARDDDPFLWGDEVEGMLVSFDDADHHFAPCLRAAELAPALSAAAEREFGDDAPHFHLEGANFNLEHTPARPFTDSLSDFLGLEASMKARRAFIRTHLALDQDFLTLSLMPRLGARDGREITFDRRANGVQRSQFVSDDLLSPHERYQKFSANLRERRGSRMVVSAPIFRDAETPWPFRDPTVNYDLCDWPEDALLTPGMVRENHIYGDAFSFGCACCALQATVQARNLNEARRLYDGLLSTTGIMLALTAATPMCKGYLTATDTRWAQLAESCDDRTPAERGEDGRVPIPMRCASNSTYLASEKTMRRQYLHPQLPIHEGVKERLLEGGMDELMAAHFAHLFIRDPFIIYEQDLQDPGPVSTVHFDMLQTTVWQALRFKPPPSSTPGGSGWRVEFRTMEIQLTDRENAAFVLFVVLLARALMCFPDVDWALPIPLVTENIERANELNAAVEQRFFFRKGSEVQELTADEIVNSQLLPLVRRYLQTQEDLKDDPDLGTYLGFVAQRANGQQKTNARWQRDFVRAHPFYKQDSVISPRIAYDMLKAIQEL